MAPQVAQKNSIILVVVKNDPFFNPSIICVIEGMGHVLFTSVPARHGYKLTLQGQSLQKNVRRFKENLRLLRGYRWVLQGQSLQRGVGEFLLWGGFWGCITGVESAFCGF